MSDTHPHPGKNRMRVRQLLKVTSLITLAGVVSLVATPGAASAATATPAASAAAAQPSAASSACTLPSGVSWYLANTVEVTIPPDFSLSIYQWQAFSNGVYYLGMVDDGSLPPDQAPTAVCASSTTQPPGWIG